VRRTGCAAALMGRRGAAARCSWHTMPLWTASYGTTGGALRPAYVRMGVCAPPRVLFTYSEGQYYR
jgi:hypothetical protein